MPTSPIDDLLSAATAVRAPALGGSVHLHCTDEDGEWLVDDGDSGALTIRHEHAKGDVAARGPAADLLALLTGGGLPSTVEVFGDDAVLGRLVERTTSDSSRRPS